MTSRRMPFGSSDDSVRASVAPLLSDLRTELLVMPREEVVDDHLAMMAFEKQILATPRFVAKTRSPLVRPRAALVRPRRTAFVIACVCATIASCGLSAAGALPEPLQHITDSIARTLGVPKPDDTPKVTHGAAAGPLPVAVVPHDAPTTPASSRATTPTKTTGHATPTNSHPTVVAPGHVSTHKVKSSAPPPYIAPRPTKPSGRITPKPGPPPSNNSENTPPGYPTDWRKLAISAATAKIGTCAQASALTEIGCPQSATAAGVNVQTQSVQWTLLNQPQSGAVAVARTKRGASGRPTTTVTVYEPFQMDASYTEAGGTRTYLAYSGGVGEATMTWNGSTFANATFSAGSAAGHLIHGVTVAPIARPAAATDANVLAAVAAGIGDCTTITSPGANPTPNCAASAGPWSVVGDPTQGAVVAFDPTQGTFTVTGTFTMTGTAADGTTSTVTGPYTASLFFDGRQLQVLSITAGP
jgi:hypothetical protein